jgi:hypothetical protein
MCLIISLMYYENKHLINGRLFARRRIKNKRKYLELSQS